MREMRYNSINAELKRRFGCKVFKVALESGCSCPNRDGAFGTSGCVFCHTDSYVVMEHSLAGGIEYVRKRHGAAKFISYFQSGTNTYGPVERLMPMFKKAIDHPDVVGLSIGTRPDCLENGHVEMLGELSKETMLWLEMGLQSANDETLKRIKRGHTVKDFLDAALILKKEKISVVAHVILGLPGESPLDMANTARLLNRAGVDGVKIHNLHVLKGTLLEKWYNDGRFEVLDLTTYAGRVADFLELLDPDILIHRVNGHAPRDLTVAPEWSVNKLAIFNAVERELKTRNTYQGKFFRAYSIASQGPPPSY